MTTIYQPLKNIWLIQHREGRIQQSLRAQFKAFPDIHTKIEHIVAENDLVAVYLNFTGTHKGEFQGIPPTNKKINIRSADLYRIENEKIVEHWDVVDQLNLLQQTGATLPQVSKKEGCNREIN
jgi:predicted ester cyclase